MRIMTVAFALGTALVPDNRPSSTGAARPKSADFVAKVGSNGLGS
jgi:hypothetical protein